MARTLLQSYVAEQVRHSVVRLRDEEVDPKGVATGFFITPTGYLITAFHAVKHRFIGGADTSPIRIEFDTPASSGGPAAVARHTVSAHTTMEWADPVADWALLKLDFEPAGYLPLAPAGEQTDDPDRAELRVYGFNITDQSTAKQCVFKGDYAGYVPDKRRYVVSYVVRAEGQSGGPVMDLRTGCVIGSVVGYRPREVLTGEAARLDHEILGRLGLDLDLRRLADDWRTRLARHICTHDDTLAPLLDSITSPPLPARALHRREIVRQVASMLGPGGRPSVLLHGAGGSGKTTAAAEAAELTASRQQDGSVFYHDFAVEGNAGHDVLLRALSVHLLMRCSLFDPLMACLDGDPSGQHSGIAAMIYAAARERSIVFVLDNIHHLSRDTHARVLDFLAGLESAAASGRSRVLLLSRYLPPPGIRAPVVPVSGFTEQEVSGFLELYGVRLDGAELTNVCRFRSSIVCMEEIARSPEWRRKVAAGEEGAGAGGATEALRRYWTDNYAHLPEADHALLLTAAVIGRPATREELEEISGVENFAATLDRLLREPPLIKSGDGYYLHSDIESAVLFVSDGRRITALRERAAVCFTRMRRYLEAARQHSLAGQTGRALELLYQHCETLITGGLVGELEQAVQDLIEGPDPEAQRRGSHHINTVLARCRTARGHYHQAQPHWRFAIRTASDDSARAALLKRLGDNDRMASDYESAARSYREAVKLLRQRDGDAADMAELAGASIGLGKLDRLWAFYDRALGRYADARESYSVLLDVTGLAEAEFGIGEVSRLRSDWQASETAYRNSYRHATSAGNLERQAYALWGIGEICRLTGRPDEALEHHRAGLDICVKIGDRRSEGWALLGIGQVEHAAGRPAFARAAFDEALQLFRRTRSDTETAHALLSLAETRRSAGTVDMSLYEQSGTLYRKLNLRHCLVQHSIVKSCALRSMGRRREGKAVLRTAHRLARKCGIEAETRLIESLRSDPDTIVFPELNFP
ncbi:tetratricopeptide repeat-containing serine protease family protein [Streptomyces sp. YIM 98790]|uniref:tetratricopeptide repeat-containing serine protease family protein n=1 Tax=Streptomyces sp. YIM 98790 TaxID=2689077 RepID=UPI00140E798F|nr:tetratricopeptide repeat-containing serine protease family protein [Streptomyces sp. YIM 98790]